METFINKHYCPIVIMKEIKSFKQNVQDSFSRVRNDVEGFKGNVTEWILFLQQNNEYLRRRIEQLEDRISTLEKRELLKGKIC